MKVLFAVSSEAISEGIVRQYQKEYKEILSYKNVYYFNAILKEIQQDKSYDRIVISEDLESFSNNNYEQIDKFLFEKLDNISDEAQDINGQETAIILICSERRNKGSAFLNKIFSIGIYNALLGQDRIKTNVCKLINKPRIKKEAKTYYAIDAEDASYDQSNDEEVSEIEITNIRNHFRKLGKNTDKYAESFNNIAAQYTDDQLKIVVNCLPTQVKQVLEKTSPRYQEFMAAGNVKSVANMSVEEEAKSSGLKMDFISKNKNTIDKPIVIPSTVRRRTPSASGTTSSNSSGVSTIRRVTNTIKPEANKAPTPAEEKTAENVENELDALDDLLAPQADNVNDINDNLLNMDNSSNEVPNEPDDMLSSLDDLGGTDDLLNPEPTAEQPAAEDDGVLPGFDDLGGSDDLLNPEPTAEEPAAEDDGILPGFDDLGGTDDLLNPEPTAEQPAAEDDLLPGFDDLGGTDDLLNPEPTAEQPAAEDDGILPGFDDLGGSDDLLNPEPTAEEPAAEDDGILPGFDDLGGTDDLLNPEPTAEQPAAEDDLLPGFDDLGGTDDLLNPEPTAEESTVKTDETLPETDDLSNIDDEEPKKRGRGRPRKIITEPPKPKGKRGRPRKNPVGEDGSTLPGMGFEDDEYTDEVDIEGLDELDDYTDESFGDVETNNTSDDGMLPGLDDIDIPDDTTSNSSDSSVDDILSGLDDIGGDTTVTDSTSNEDTSLDDILPGLDDVDDILGSETQTNNNPEPTKIDTVKPTVDYSMSSLNSLLTPDKKIATFIGTSKNGTSFLVNNLGLLFDTIGKNVAILDMTKNRNSYYIFNCNDEELRKVCNNSFSNLERGVAEGIRVKPNLTVYTGLPDDGKVYKNVEAMLSTLVQNHDIVLIDCDFDTDPSFFAMCQEIYLVQSMDTLTIQPLTYFLKILQDREVLEPEKIRIVLNKVVKLRGFQPKDFVGGMSCYNAPSMSVMRTLFNPQLVKVFTINFEESVYIRYLDAIAACKMTLDGYSKTFMAALKQLAQSVYSFNNGGGMRTNIGAPTQPQMRPGAQFTSNMNNTLDKMKRNMN